MWKPFDTEWQTFLWALAEKPNGKPGEPHVGNQEKLTLETRRNPMRISGMPDQGRHCEQ